MQGLAADYAASLPAQDMGSMILGLEGILPQVPQVTAVPLGDRDGAYDPEHHLILIDSAASPQRQRFTLAHEISHALLLNDDDLLSDVHDLFEGDRLEQAIETLCNVGAAAMLMPPALVRELLGRFGPTGRALSELARRADVSASAALYTLAAETDAAVLYAVCGAGRGAGEALQVRVSAASPAFPYSLSPGTAIPAGHPVQEAKASGLPVEAPSYLPFRSGRRMPAYVTAYPAGGLVTVAFALGQAQLERLGTLPSQASADS
ncbi:radiation response metalloprotease IrrE [Deinococcus piscis]|uniref:Radiation response metalloprotease IrrE n=1 Tax=Deinococcus piscis TaxID=394230 RepID=A0ABQ3K545_9DEIO|nr:radiation response metalloprotease IrrE [Deinococcus piscis]